LIRIKAGQPRNRDHRNQKGIAMICLRARESSALLAKVLGRWRGLRRRRHCLAELGRFPAGLELLAQDMNLSSSELRAIAAKWPDGSDLLRRRLAMLELDPDASALRDLERVCTLCANKRACERNLATSVTGADWRGYCLNVPTFDALQSEAGRS
jgi:hypothetical protein